MTFDEVFQQQRSGRRVERGEDFHAVPLDTSGVVVYLRSLRIREVWKGGKPTGRPDVDEEGRALVQAEFDFDFGDDGALPVRSGFMRVDERTFAKWQSYVGEQVLFGHPFVRPSVADARVSRAGETYGGKTEWTFLFEIMISFDEYEEREAQRQAQREARKKASNS
jgi:hypothetical protein